MLAMAAGGELVTRILYSVILGKGLQQVLV